MSSYRPDRSSLGIDASIGELKNNKDILYGSDIADACVKVTKEKQIKF